MTLTGMRIGPSCCGLSAGQLPFITPSKGILHKPLLADLYRCSVKRHIIALVSCARSAVLLEVAHFASLTEAGREVCILRSDNGMTWHEHQLQASDDNVSAVLANNFDSKLHIPSYIDLLDLCLVAASVAEATDHLAPSSSVLLHLPPAEPEA